MLFVKYCQRILVFNNYVFFFYTNNQFTILIVLAYCTSYTSQESISFQFYNLSNSIPRPKTLFSQKFIKYIKPIYFLDFKNLLILVFLDVPHFLLNNGYVSNIHQTLQSKLYRQKSSSLLSRGNIEKTRLELDKNVVGIFFG